MIFPMIGDGASWLLSPISFLFIGLFDTIAYTLLVAGYNVFYAVAQLDLFGGGAAGEALYENITGRFYTIISIIMIFVFAYQLIMLVVDPDGKEKKSSSSLVKDTLFSLILVIVLPTIFKYMALFQNHVLMDNTIGALIMGTGNSSHDQNPGKIVALMTLVSFYHPEGTSYDTFYYEDGLRPWDYDTSYNGEKREGAKELCEEQTLEYQKAQGIDGTAHVKTCEQYYLSLKAWEETDGISVGAITWNTWLHGLVTDTMEYMWILSTAGALVAAWFFFSYAMDLGTRAVKLGVLQLISPIPVILRIFPYSRKTYETWFGELKKTYLEVFIRVGVIFFILELIKLIPVFIRILADANDSLNGVAKCIATLILILGMLKFAKDAPDLFKTLFSTGGNLLSGLNFKPGMKKRVEDNTYAMKGIGAATGALNGGISRVMSQYRRNMDMTSHTNSGRNGLGARRVMAGLGAITAIPRGVISGGRSGFRNSPTELNGRALRNVRDQGVAAAHNSYRNAAFRGTRDNFASFVNDITNSGNGAVRSNAFSNLASRQGGIIVNHATEAVQGRKESFEEWKKMMLGESRDMNQIQSSANTIKSLVDEMKKFAQSATKANNDLIEMYKKQKESTTDDTVIAALDAKIASLKNQILNQQAAIYNSDTNRKNRAQVGAQLSDAILSAGFSDELIEELNNKVRSAGAGDNIKELLDAFRDENNNGITDQQVKALNDITSRIGQAGIDAGVMASLQQSQSSTGSNKADNKDKK